MDFIYLTFLKRIAKKKIVNDISLKSQLKKYINKFPRLKKIIKTMIKNNDQLSLTKLKNKSSPYNEDFMPVYKLLTKE